MKRLVALLACVSALGLGCGRTDLEFSGASGPARPDSGAGGAAGSRVDAAVTGGTSGTGGRTPPPMGGRAATGGRSGSGGAPSDGGVRDGAVDARPTDAATDLPPSTPGLLTCGTQACDTRTQTCCVTLAVGATATRCIPTAATCPGADLACDEPLDCATGVCCFGLQTSGAGVSIGSSCAPRATCGGVGRFVVCRTNADCGAAAPICCRSFGVPICQATCSGR